VTVPCSSFPVFTGHLDTVSLAKKGDVAVGAYDLAADVIAAGFETPTNSSAGVKLLTQYQTLIKGALTNPTFGTSDATGSTMPALIWESDRGKALDDVASAAGMIWYPLPDGSFVMRLRTRHGTDLADPLRWPAGQACAPDPEPGTAHPGPVCGGGQDGAPVQQGADGQLR
jgi:hypothetical protein